jgi:hypothetical protein
LRQPLPDLADEAAGRPRALVDAEQDGLRAAAQRQIRSEVGQAGALWQHHQQFRRFEFVRQKLFWLIDNDGQGCGTLPNGDLPVWRRAVAQMTGDALAPLSLNGEKDAHLV